MKGGTDGEMATLYVRGNSESVVEEMERAIDGPLEIVAEADTGGVVPGAGSTEMSIANELRDHAVGIRNSKQLYSA